MDVLEPIEIRLLGSLRARRCDNSAVHAAEWRTGKTTDLLRLLALNVDQPVRIDGLLDKLWPDVEESKGRASLRTAASQIRRTLRSDCIERRRGELALRDAWVDVTAFRDLLVQARACYRSGDHAQTVSLTRQAEAMYLGDFEAHDGGSAWAVETRESIRTMRLALLTDAVDCAVELRWLRDAVDLASLVIDADPYSDRGHRGLMRAYAGLGETDRALRVFADFRSLLDQELGVAPSPQTQATQASLLAGTIEPAQAPGWVGHEEDRTAVVRLLNEERQHGVRLMCVTGPPGCGREAVVDAAINSTSVTAVHLHAQSSAPLPATTEINAAARRARVVVLPPLDPCDDTDIAELVAALAALEPVKDLTIVVPVDPQHQEAMLLESEMVQLEVDTVELHALTRVELERLAAGILCGPPAPALVDALTAASGGLHHKATTELHHWRAAGWILWTPTGLDLASSHDEMPEAEVDRIIHRILERVCPLGMDVVSLLALLDRPADATLILHLLDRVAWPDVTENDVDLALDQLADLGAVRSGLRGYEFMHARMRPATEAWLRHGVRRRLHRRLAESPLLSEEDRARHWSKAAAPVRAALSEFDAAQAARETGDTRSALQHLQVATEYASLASTSAEKVSLLHRMSDTSHEVGASELAATIVAALNGLPAILSSSYPGAEVGLTAQAAFIEHTVRQVLGPLLPGVHVEVALSAISAMEQPATAGSRDRAAQRSRTRVPVPRSA